MPRTSVKGQVLVDLVAEFAESLAEEEVEKQGLNGKLVGMVSSREPLFGGYMLMRSKSKRFQTRSSSGIS